MRKQSANTRKARRIRIRGRRDLGIMCFVEEGRKKRKKRREEKVKNSFFSLFNLSRFNQGLITFLLLFFRVFFVLVSFLFVIFCFSFVFFFSFFFFFPN